MRRWIGGYRAAERQHERLWTPQLPKLDNQWGLGFLDLMQLRIVARIVAQTDISLQKLRKALRVAEELIQHTHPLATARFRTDGRKLFVEIGAEANEPELVDLLGGQYGFHRIIEPSFKDVDLGTEITRWWPLGRKHSVVVDPRRSLGAPILNRSGIRTATLASAAEREGSFRKVTRWYPVSEREVRDAVTFEHRIAGVRPRQKAA